MICLYGEVAASGFRRDQLLRKLRNVDSQIESVDCRYVYFVDVTPAVHTSDPALIDNLCSLLSADQHPPDVAVAAALVVVPRLGTRSPWSSKATDIAARCGFDSVKRIERGIWYRLHRLQSAHAQTMTDEELQLLGTVLHDRMTESVIDFNEAQQRIFSQAEPASLNTVSLLEHGIAALARHNKEHGLALSPGELVYLNQAFTRLERNPSDAELMMFAQANSEHCRHKIFNAQWTVDGEVQERSLFAMIRHTYEQSPDGVLSAYHDNAAVIKGFEATRWLPDESGQYRQFSEPAHIQIKVETHNHPTAISPFPGAATGSGGEIRDEGAVGNGAKPKAGLCGFSVSNLDIPDFAQPWERYSQRPGHIASALQIMLEGPIGAASFNNEFGRPNLAGYFRTYCCELPMSDGSVEVRGYHKPIMIAGGMGNIRPVNVDKKPVPVNAVIVVLGGPSMLIGLGGGAASSMTSGQSDVELDFASVQRGNPEMQRRCQEVIDRCITMGDSSPILSMHDVGAGGLSNALPELVNDAGRGAIFELRAIPNDEPGMSPMAIWSNEAQERYVMAIDAARLVAFDAICQRERCPYAAVGQTSGPRHLTVTDSHFKNRPVDMPLEVLLGKPPRLKIDAEHRPGVSDDFDVSSIELEEAVHRVLALPAVAAKNFLITIGDRSITGQVVRDQLVGPWQMPVSDLAVTAADFSGYTGEAMAMGERAPLAVINSAASARMAIGEALTNIVAARIGSPGSVKLSANWMAATGDANDNAALFDAVQAAGMELAPALGIAIPVGKDSLSMQTVWPAEDGLQHSVTAPLSLIVSAFAPVLDVRKTLTPQLQDLDEETELLAIDLGLGKNRLGGSALAQVFDALGDQVPDVDDPSLLKGLFDAIQTLQEQDLILAWHDRSDGGLFVTVSEMAFASNSGLSISLDSFEGDINAILFNEELGGVLQISSRNFEAVMRIMAAHGLADCVHRIGGINESPNLDIRRHDSVLFSLTVNELRCQWWFTSYHMQRLRDNPVCADQELEHVTDWHDPGISPHLSFDPDRSIADSAPAILQARPKVAVLRDQGVNGHIEMAVAFNKAGFEPVDVHMSDLTEQRRDLSEFKGLVACGGFSYGDVLGAGGGWANSILHNQKLAGMFATFFARQDAFALGVCNGCQMLSRLKSLIPGAQHWPGFVRNFSEQFEARLITVQVEKTPSIFLTDMDGSRLPVVVAHGEGKVLFESDVHAEQAQNSGTVALSFVDNRGHVTERYPLNPNGSVDGVTGLCNADGRVTIMMPHPERVIRTVCQSWAPADWGERSPWMRLFENARRWVS